MVRKTRELSVNDKAFKDAMDLRSELVKDLDLVKSTEQLLKIDERINALPKLEDLKLVQSASMRYWSGIIQKKYDLLSKKYKPIPSVDADASGYEAVDTGKPSDGCIYTEVDAGGYKAIDSEMPSDGYARTEVDISGYKAVDGDKPSAGHSCPEVDISGYKAVKGDKSSAGYSYTDANAIGYKTVEIDEPCDYSFYQDADSLDSKNMKTHREQYVEAVRAKIAILADKAAELVAKHLQYSFAGSKQAEQYRLARDSALKLIKNINELTDKFVAHKISLSEYKLQAKALLGKENDDVKVLHTHRGWKEIIANVLAAIVGNVLFFIAAAAAGTFCLFKPATDSAKKVADLATAVKNVEESDDDIIQDYNYEQVDSISYKS